MSDIGLRYLRSSSKEYGGRPRFTDDPFFLIPTGSRDELLADVSRRLARLTEYADEAAKYGGIPWDLYRDDRRTRLALQRITELIAFNATWIARSVLVANGIAPKDEIILLGRQLGEAGFLPVRLAVAFGNTVEGTRYRVQGDEGHDDKSYYRGIQSILKLIPRFVQSIQAQLDRQLS